MIKGKDLRSLRNSSTLDLAFYEIGNSVIQEEKMGIIDEKASGALSSVLQSLPDIMNVVLFEKVKTTTVLEIAKDSRLTFYDASYIAMAKDRNEPLVTEDVHLAKAASKMGMRTYTTTHLFGSESTKNAQG